MPADIVSTHQIGDTVDDIGNQVSEQILKKVRFTSDFTTEDHVYSKSNDYDDYDYYDYDFDEDGEESIV